jgi:type II secretory pathway predicted ATPase ExeA
MYRDYFKLRERPFTHAPGRRFFMPNTAVAEAIGRLQHLLTARDAIAVISGGPGTGKSAVIEQALSAAGERVVVARVDMRHAEAEELGPALLLALGDDISPSSAARVFDGLRRAMSRYGREGQRLVLTLDTGGLTSDLAKHLLRLANLAGEHDCQLNIVLQGPHTLHQQVDVPALIQLRQRISYRYRVRPLTLAETDRYIRYQIEAVGGDAAKIVTGTVSTAVYCFVAGVPRLINTLMDAALSEACLAEIDQPDGNQVKRAAEQLGWKPLTPKHSATPTAASAAGARPAVSTASPAQADSASQTSRLRMLRSVPAPGPAPAPAKLMPVPLSSLTPRASDDAPRVEPRKSSPLPKPLVAMDATDTGATGMLRLQDLDDRFAETVFGKDMEDAAAALRGKDPEKN